MEFPEFMVSRQLEISLWSFRSGELIKNGTKVMNVLFAVVTGLGLKS